MRLPLTLPSPRHSLPAVAKSRDRPIALRDEGPGVTPLAQLGVAECQRKCNRLYPNDRSAQIACYREYCTI